VSSTTSRSRKRCAPVFPHVHGPIDRAAITGVGVLHATDDDYAWPESFDALEVLVYPCS
jgi:hypothetical protein